MAELPEPADRGTQAPPRAGAAYRAPLTYAVLAFLLYSINGRVVATGDSLPARFIPFAILGHGTVMLDPVADATRSDQPTPYWMQPTLDGHTASLFPIVTPVVVTPLYIPAVAYLSAVGWTEPRLRAIGVIMEKVAASVVAATAVGLMFVLLRRSTSPADARLLTIAFAAGTTTWAISSQALWQHGVGQMSLLAALVAITDVPRWSRVVIAGAAAGILATNRPLDAFFAIAIGACALGWIRRASDDRAQSRARLAVLAIAAAVPVGLALAYNLRAFGHVWGGYGATGHFSPAYFGYSFWEGIAGLLISPGKGILVYSPFLLALLVVNPFRSHPYPKLAAYLAAAVALQIPIYAMADWRGGTSFGYRPLTDATPILVWLLVAPLASLTRTRRHVFVGAVACAIAVQAIGALKYDGKSDLIMYAPGRTREFESAWRIQDSPILIEAREPLARPFLLDQLSRLR